jgi:hypothetical protein
MKPPESRSGLAAFERLGVDSRIDPEARGKAETELALHADAGSRAGASSKGGGAAGTPSSVGEPTLCACALRIPSPRHHDDDDAEQANISTVAVLR